MLTLKHLGCAAIAATFVMALAIEAADARRGGGGGGMRAGGFSGGGGMRAGGGGAIRAGGGGGGRFATGGVRPSHPIARPGLPGGGGAGWANRPGGPGWANRPGYGPGWGGGYRPGYGWGAAAAAGAIGAGIAYSGYSNYGYSDPAYGYYDPGYVDPGYVDPGYGYSQPVAGSSDAVAECARLFKTYDVASQTYIKSKGVRASCP